MHTQAIEVPEMMNSGLHLSDVWAWTNWNIRERTGDQQPDGGSEIKAQAPAQTQDQQYWIDSGIMYNMQKERCYSTSHGNTTNHHKLLRSV